MSIRRQSVLNSIESLLLAQAVWEFGAGPESWNNVSKTLSKHPLLLRPKSFFSPQSCHAIYNNLMREAGLDINEANHIPHAQINLQLAQKHFRSRFHELQELILTEESKFKTILSEIEEIRSGLWDKEIQTKITGEVPERVAAHPHNFRSTEVIAKPQSLLPETLNILTEDGPSSIPSLDQFPDKDLNTFTKEASLPTSEVPLQAVDVSPGAVEMLDPDGMKFVKDDIIQELKVDRLNEKTESMNKITDQITEEREEGLNPEKESKEEGKKLHGYDNVECALPVEQDTGEVNSFKPADQVDAETESDTPMEIYTAEIETPAERDEVQSGTEEREVQPRRSSRKRKTPPPPPQTRTRLRSQARIIEPLGANEYENEADSETKGNSPQNEQESVPSSFEKRREGKRKASFLEITEYPHDKKRLREDSEPVEEEEQGPSSHSTRTRVTRQAMRTEEQVALKRFQNVIGMLHSQISQHRNGNIFHNPIKNSEAPDYHEIVKRPMDLKTIKTRVKDGVIANSLEFQRDIYLMFANAMMYNRPGSDVHAMAEDMMLESEGQIIAFRQTEGLVKRGQRA